MTLTINTRNLILSAEDILCLSPVSMKAEMQNQIMQLREKQNYCADCFSPDPEWTSTSFGIFICVACCGIHRHLGTHISRVKSIKLDDWSQQLVQEMRRNSNANSNSMYLRYFPRPFKRIDHSDPVYLREEIIMDKYLRKCYTKSTNWAPFKVGYVRKRGKYANKWAIRFFKLINGRLVYFKTQNDIDNELGKLEVDKVWISDGKLGRNYTLQVIGSDGRSLFMLFEDGKELLDWFNYLRLAKAHILSIDKPLLLSGNDAASINSEEGGNFDSRMFDYAAFVSEITDYERQLKCSLVVEGYLEYQLVEGDENLRQQMSIVNLQSSAATALPPSVLPSVSSVSKGWFNRKKWQKVFATLTHDKLYIYKNPLDAYPIDIIMVQEVSSSPHSSCSSSTCYNSNNSNSCPSTSSVPSSCASSCNGTPSPSICSTASSNFEVEFSLTRGLDGRKWIFKCESALAQERWTNAINSIASKLNKIPT